MSRTTFWLNLVNCSLSLCVPLKTDTAGFDAFSKHFVKIKTVSLSEDVIVGQVSHLDVDSAGNLLVTDFIGKGVHIFDEKGRLKKTLNANECHPGFRWFPIKAVYAPDQKIFLINSAPWGFLFKSNGECLGSVDRSFLAPNHITFDENGNIYGYYAAEDGNYLKKMNSFGRELGRFGKFPDQFKRIIGRYDGGGGLVFDKKKYLYQVDLTSPKLLKYDLEGRLIQAIERSPSFYKPITDDLPDVGPNTREITGSFSRITQGKSLTISLFLLDDDKLLVQYLHDRVYAIEIIEPTKNTQVRNAIKSPDHIVLAKSRLAYIVKQPSQDTSGNLPNPVIEVFRYQPAR